MHIFDSLGIGGAIIPPWKWFIFSGNFLVILGFLDKQSELNRVKATWRTVWRILSWRTIFYTWRIQTVGERKSNLVNIKGNFANQWHWDKTSVVKQGLTIRSSLKPYDPVLEFAIILQVEQLSRKKWHILRNFSKF